MFYLDLLIRFIILDDSTDLSYLSVCPNPYYVSDISPFIILLL